jgi:hypothetical protein
MKELHLRVFTDRSELVRADGSIELFLEGNSSNVTRQRYERIVQSLDQGYLHDQIRKCRDEPSTLDFSKFSETHQLLFDALIASMNQDSGRALVGLTVLQLCIKAIEPDQSIRLHKSNTWQEGISMRTLDSRFITPALRQYDLLKMNKDGFMMTRTLAENYPYSKVYKAQIRGARQEWAEIVEAIELKEIQSEVALWYVLSQLLNRASDFKTLVKETLDSLSMCLIEGKLSKRSEVLALVQQHAEISNYAARVMEVSLHSLMQALQELEVFDSQLNAAIRVQALSQMKSANKKHGNIGDIELLDVDGDIIESWDAKYGKSYLRDELEELNDKLFDQDKIRIAGFVTSIPPERLGELEPRMDEIASLLPGLSLSILTLAEWTALQYNRAINGSTASEKEISERWVKAYVESIAQLRREWAPIDEPCVQWLESLKKLLTTGWA